MTTPIAAPVLDVANVNALTAGDSPPTARAVPDAQLQRAAEQFEEIFVRQMLESSGIAQAGGKGYSDMVVDAFAQAITSGRGLGFGDQIARMLAETHHRGPAAVQGTEAAQAGASVAVPRDDP